MNVERMTQRVQEALNAAYTRALSEHNTQTTPEHLLAAVLAQTDGVAAPILEKAGLDPRDIDQQTDRLIAALPRLQGASADQSQVTVSPGLSRLLAAADNEAKSLNDDYVSVEHVLLAMTSDSGAVGKLFRERGLSREKLLAALREVRGNQRVTTQNPEGTYQSLERYGRDLTKAAQAGQLDPVIGRDEEIRRVIQVLSRRTKNNPVLIGEPGVGKTAIAEGLAQRIVRGDVAAVQTAIASVADQAANVGATQNQITSLASNLTTAQQNIESAHANLVDVNVAQETSVFASDQILEQSGVSVLAQAEQLPSLAEKLLQ